MVFGNRQTRIGNCRRV